MIEDYSVINKKISMKIKLERTKRNMSQEDLALESGLSRNAIWKIETSQVSPTIETLVKIANAFKMNFIDLVNVEKFEL